MFRQPSISGLLSCSCQSGSPLSAVPLFFCAAHIGRRGKFWQRRFSCLSEAQFPPVGTQHPEAERSKCPEGHPYVSFLGRYMRTAQFAIVFLLSLTLGCFLAVPIDNLPETAFDESETLPCRSTPVLRIAAPAPARTPQSKLKSGSPIHLGDLTRRCERRGHGAWSSHPISVSLTILNHLFRC